MPEPKKPSKDPFASQPRKAAGPPEPWKAPGWLPGWSLRAWFMIAMLTMIGGLIAGGIVDDAFSKDEEESVLGSITPVPFADQLYEALSSYDDADATRLCLMTRLGDARSRYKDICNTWIEAVEPNVLEEDLRHEYMDGFAIAVAQAP